MTRWLPFLLFPEAKQPPAVVAYLGKVLPPAMMGLLVVYCFKGMSLAFRHPRRAGADRHAAVVGCSICWKRNVLLSIAAVPRCIWCFFRSCSPDA